MSREVPRPTAPISIRSPLFTAPVSLSPAPLGSVAATDSGGVLSTFHLGGGPDESASAGTGLSLEQYPAPAEARRHGLGQLLLLTIEAPRFDFLTFEYRIPRGLLANRARIGLRLFAMSDDALTCRLAIGGTVEPPRFEFFTMQPCLLDETCRQTLHTVDAGLLPLGTLVGEHLSACLLFERRAAAIGFALMVEIA